MAKKKEQRTKKEINIIESCGWGFKETKKEKKKKKERNS